MRDGVREGRMRDDVWARDMRDDVCEGGRAGPVAPGIMHPVSLPH